MGNTFRPVIPAMNTLWFHFPKSDRRALHGTQPDVERKFAVLDRCGLADQGMEMFLMPCRLADHAFSGAFLDRYAALPFRSVHIGDGDHDFLDQPGAGEDLARLAAIMGDLNADRIILHAVHLKDNRAARARLLRETLPGVTMVVENNGFDNRWGAEPGSLKAIFADCPDFRFCLDITHVKDFTDLGLADFTVPELLGVLEEIHWSCSTYLMGEDPYVSRGFPGYNPFHALFPLTDVVPSERTLNFVAGYPVIMEGVVPPEDTELKYLHQEKAILMRNRSI